MAELHFTKGEEYWFEMWLYQHTVTIDSEESLKEAIKSYTGRPFDDKDQPLNYQLLTSF
jgi:hypothetical protein